MSILIDNSDVDQSDKTDDIFIKVINLLKIILYLIK
jgi:hypothetical protein